MIRSSRAFDANERVFEYRKSIAVVQENVLLFKGFLGPTIKDRPDLNSVGTRAARAAGVIVDALGKLRCPPGTPNANQFTDLQMTNCLIPSAEAVAKDTAKLASKLVDGAKEILKSSKTKNSVKATAMIALQVMDYIHVDGSGALTDSTLMSMLILRSGGAQLLDFVSESLEKRGKIYPSVKQRMDIVSAKLKKDSAIDAKNFLLASIRRKKDKDAEKKKIDTPTNKAKTVEEGLQRILAGEDVEMDDIAGAHTLISELAKMAQEAKNSGGKELEYDLCKVSVKGTNLFCAGNKGIPRDAMPQAKGDVVEGSSAAKLLEIQNAQRLKDGKKISAEVDGTESFLKYLSDAGISASEPKRVRSDKLKATQLNMKGETVGGMIASKDYDPSAEPIFVSRDGYVVDGHHRWAATLGKDAEDGILGNNHLMNVIVLDAPISKILKEANAWTDEFGIKRKTVGKTPKKD